MNDVYNHVARAAVLIHYDDIVALREYWIPNWRLVPYLGYDLIEMWLLTWFSMGLVVKIMVAASLAALFGGAMVLSRSAHGKWSAFALASVLLLVNRTLLAGFINYLFGIGISLMGAAVWIALRDRPVGVRLLGLGVIATVVCAVHLFAGGVLGVMVAGIEIATLLERRPSLFQSAVALAVPVLAFLPVFLVWIFIVPHPAGHALITYRSLTSRLGAFAVPLTYAPLEEVAGFLAIGVAVAALWFSGRVTVDRRLAVAAALLALVQLAMPADIGSATVADHRIPIAFWMVVVCAIDVRLEKRPLAFGFMALIGVVFLSRVALLQVHWTQDNVVYDQANQAMASLPGNARVATAFPASGLNSATRPDVALYYMPAMEFAPRGGFTQILFAIEDQHSLVMRPAFVRLTSEAAPEAIWHRFVTPSDSSYTPLRGTDVLAAIQDYDYVVFLNAEPFTLQPTNLLEAVSDAPGIRIYRVLREAAERADTAAKPSGLRAGPPS